MKKSLPILTTGLALTLIASMTNAALINRGNGMIYDDDLNITWLADSKLFKSQYAENSDILNSLIGQTVVDQHYGSHVTTAADFFPSFGAMTWWGAQAWASNLSYGGYDDWRLPTTLQPDSSCDIQTSTASWGRYCSGSELGHLYYVELGGNANNYYGLFSNVGQFQYWSGSEYTTDSYYAWLYIPYYGTQYMDSKTAPYYAWAVRDGDVLTEPGTLTLLGLGMFGMLLKGHKMHIL